MIPCGCLVIPSLLETFSVPQITGKQQPSLLKQTGKRKKERAKARAQLISHTSSNGLTTNTKILENPLRFFPPSNLPRQPTSLPMPEIWRRPVIVRLHHARRRSLRQPELQPELFEMAGIYKEIRRAIIGLCFFTLPAFMVLFYFSKKKENIIIKREKRNPTANL